MSHASANPLEKRIKRHVIARERAFFVTTVPGFEKLLEESLNALHFPSEGLRSSEGGVECTGRLTDCYLANLKLRTAHRVLMRLTTFKADNFRRLRRKVTAFPWELFMVPGARPEMHITTRHSRLHHTTAVGDCIQEGILERLSGMTASLEVREEISPPKVYGRALDDVFTLSLDSSGELLYKRGLKSHIARAPLRETIAAGALMLAGYDGTRPLLDPFCGSGTFSLEAALIARNIPPGWFRDFAFMTWPAFRSRQWLHLRKEAAKGISPSPAQPSIFASDIDPVSCKHLMKTLTHFGIADSIEVYRSDFFNLSSDSVPNGPGILTLNPPYGRRLGSRRQSDALFLEICLKLKKDFRGWVVALVVPRGYLLKKVSLPLQRHPFLHGGLGLHLLTGNIP